MPRRKAAVAVVPAAAAAPELFVKIGASGEELPLEAGEWEAVKHRASGLLFPALLPGVAVPWKQALQQPKALKIAGRTDWRLATRVEGLLIVDDTKFLPAVDGRFFRYPKSGWCWLATRDAECPESYAWSLFLYGGVANVYLRDFRGFALAVCGPVPSPGQ